MRSSVVLPLLLCLGGAITGVHADAVPAVEPVEEAPVRAGASPAAVAEAAEVAAPAPARVAPSAPAYADPAPRSEGDSRRASAASEKISRQTHSGYYVNRVRFSIPAGVKINVKKDWYAKDVILEYPANPYTNWEGITPLAFAFTHSGTTLEVRHVTPKYLPAVVTIRVPSAVDIVL